MNTSVWWIETNVKDLCDISCEQHGKYKLLKNESDTLNNKLIMVTDMTKNMNNECYDNVLCMLLLMW